ncbi:MAG: isoprenyl transferase [Prevotella sp.]|jgi:undecaprenyl diphosphate synthase|nr:isoprenyl transferase [Prevotella sp.]
MDYELDKSRIPQHIAIIMDGNGRWAMERGLDRSFGHKAGVEAVKRITTECSNLGVKYLTLYTFSTENWNRPAYEIEAIMDLVLNFFEMELFTKNNVRFRMVGDFGRLSDSVQKKIRYMEDLTAKNDGLTMVVALSYSSRWEITEAVRQIVTEVNDMQLPQNILKNLKTGGIRAEDITEDFISQHLQTNFMPDPELLIRTGGELRISNYLLWQIAYSELYFCDTYWPDFSEDDLHRAIASYQRRQRRFGKTEAQVEVEDER